MDGDFSICWMVWGSNPGRDKKFFCSPKLPDLFKGYSFSPRIKGAVV
jgi:hypothetical protein